MTLEATIQVGFNVVSVHSAVTGQALLFDQILGGNGAPGAVTVHRVQLADADVLIVK